MDSDKTSGEAVPMIRLNGENTNDNTVPSSPTPSQKSISITNKEKHSQTVSIDVSGEVPLIKKTVTHEQIGPLNPNDIFDMLPDVMKPPVDTTNGGNGNDPNTEAAKKKTGSKDAPDGFNRYRNEKSFSQGLLDIALFMSNVNQLRAVTNNPIQNFNFYFIVILLVLSIIIQIAVGLVLLLSARYNINKEEERKTVYTMGTYVVAGVFFITILNLLIGVFYNYDNPAGAPYNATQYS